MHCRQHYARQVWAGSGAISAQSIAADIWNALALDALALNRLSLPQGPPLLPTSFQVGLAAQATIGCAALAASELMRLRMSHAPDVSVPRDEAERECVGYFQLNGKTPVFWAPLSGMYECADGHVRVHANFDHHREAALRAVGLPPDAGREALATRLTSWQRVDFETAGLDEGGAVAACRSFDEWDALEQAHVVSMLPLLTLERIGDADPLPLSDAPDRPLSNIRVLDLTRILAGPICGRTLAAYGADVMLVNSPGLPNIENIVETSRGKLSCHVDLALDDGKARLESLIGDAHVFVQGYRPGALSRLGFAPEAIAARRPGIVCVSLSAYGAGPWEGRRGFDSLVQTATGFNLAEARAFGESNPRALPYQILDCASGYLMALAAQAGLLRQQTEGGSWHARITVTNGALAQGAGAG